MRKISPYITEKSVELAKKGKFTLRVDFDSSKKEIIGLVKKYYKIDPLACKVICGKYLQDTKYRKIYTKKGIKKAIITLEKGKTIPGFEFETKDKKAKIDKEKEKEIKKAQDVKKG